MVRYQLSLPSLAETEFPVQNSFLPSIRPPLSRNSLNCSHRGTEVCCEIAPFVALVINTIYALEVAG